MKIRKKMFDLQHRPTNQIDRYVFSITHQSMSHKQWLIRIFRKKNASQFSHEAVRNSQSLLSQQ